MTDYMKTMRKAIGHAPLMICGASVIVRRGALLLLQRRKDNNLWCYHGGGIECGEHPEEAAARELLEETGLTARSLRLFGVFGGPELHYTYPNGDEVFNIDSVYLCDDFTGELRPQPEEIAELRWFRFDRLPDALCPPVRPALLKYVDQIKEEITA